MYFCTRLFRVVNLTNSNHSSRFANVVFRCAGRVDVIGAKNAIGEPSSNFSLFCSFCINTLGNGMNHSFLLIHLLHHHLLPDLGLNQHTKLSSLASGGRPSRRRTTLNLILKRATGNKFTYVIWRSMTGFVLKGRGIQMNGH